MLYLLSGWPKTLLSRYPKIRSDGLLSEDKRLLHFTDVSACWFRFSYPQVNGLWFHHKIHTLKRNLKSVLFRRKVLLPGWEISMPMRFVLPVGWILEVVVQTIQERLAQSFLRCERLC